VDESQILIETSQIFMVFYIVYMPSANLLIMSVLATQIWDLASRN